MFWQPPVRSVAAVRQVTKRNWSASSTRACNRLCAPSGAWRDLDIHSELVDLVVLSPESGIHSRGSVALEGIPLKLVPTWQGIFGLDMAGNVLLPGEGARLAPTTFEDWLAAGAR